MADTGEIDPIELAGEIAEKALDSEPVRNLLGPVTKNVGLILGQVSEIARFYTEQNLLSIFTKWAAQRRGEPLAPQGFKGCSHSSEMWAAGSDDELQERWASLLENVANDTEGVLPSFGQTLSQITSAEAHYLDRIWERVTAPKPPFNSLKRQGRDELTYFDLKDVYSPKLRAPSPAVMRVHRGRMSPDQVAAFDEVTNFELVLHDLERLSLLEKEVEYMSGDVRKYEIGEEIVSIPSVHSGTVTTYALTQYGVNFILAVRPKRPTEN